MTRSKLPKPRWPLLGLALALALACGGLEELGEEIEGRTAGADGGAGGGGRAAPSGPMPDAWDAPEPAVTVTSKGKTYTVNATSTASLVVEDERGVPRLRLYGLNTGVLDMVTEERWVPRRSDRCGTTGKGTSRLSYMESNTEDFGFQHEHQANATASDDNPITATCIPAERKGVRMEVEVRERYGPKPRDRVATYTADVIYKDPHVVELPDNGGYLMLLGRMYGFEGVEPAVHPGEGKKDGPEGGQGGREVTPPRPGGGAGAPDPAAGVRGQARPPTPGGKAGKGGKGGKGGSTPPRGDGAGPTPPTPGGDGEQGRRPPRGEQTGGPGQPTAAGGEGEPMRQGADAWTHYSSLSDIVAWWAPDPDFAEGLKGPFLLVHTLDWDPDLDYRGSIGVPGAAVVGEGADAAMYLYYAAEATRSTPYVDAVEGYEGASYEARTGVKRIRLSDLRQAIRKGGGDELSWTIADAVPGELLGGVRIWTPEAGSSPTDDPLRLQPLDDIYEVAGRPVDPCPFTCAKGLQLFSTRMPEGGNFDAIAQGQGIWHATTLPEGRRIRTDDGEEHTARYGVDFIVRAPNSEGETPDLIQSDADLPASTRERVLIDADVIELSPGRITVFTGSMDHSALYRTDGKLEEACTVWTEAW